ncbi:MAG: DUF4838 domain-containing protein, partial [Planctomycetes bacterium]|nr:DUF4838 domain-containing protein [Planctomycetota bacterium]
MRDSQQRLELDVRQSSRAVLPYRRGNLSASRALIVTCLALAGFGGWPFVDSAVCGEATTPCAVVIADDGQAPLPIIVGENASERVRLAAQTLGDYLERITGAAFSIRAGDGKSGLAVGLPADFPATPHADKWRHTEIFQRENYLLQSHSGGLFLLGATELAVEHAVWDLLGRVGYRQFFPGKHWEIIPRHNRLEISLDVVESPDYHSRRIWYGFGPWDYAQEPYRQWCARNRATSGVALNTGHAYGGIIRSNRELFQEHPEWLALVDGQRQKPVEGAKFCISNADLRRAVAEYAVRYFADNPDADSISMDPSDGGGWCQCPACQAMGSVSDRALTLANEVAQTVAARFPEKLVGMYAYNYHSPPPSIRAAPQVVISVATAFIKGGYSLDDLIGGWSGKGATLGIREYYSVNTWDRDLPGRSRGSNLSYLSSTIPKFHASGARFLSAESSDNWGPNGLGYYVASKILWDVDEAANADHIVDDFLTRAFGAAREPMREFYRLIDGSQRQRQLVYEDFIGRMYRQLQRAIELADTPEVRARLGDLVLYTRYVDLYQRYSVAKGNERQAAFAALIQHAYRMRTTMMVHSKALYRDLAARDKSVSIPADAAWNVPEERNPWKSSEEFTAAELAQFVRDGIADHPLVELGFEPIAFSEELVPAGPLRLQHGAAGDFGAGRGEQTFFTWISAVPGTLELRVTGGLIPHYRDRGNVKIDLWQIGGASRDGQREQRVTHDESVPPDGQTRIVRLSFQQPGLHRVDVSDGRDMTRVEPPPGIPWTFRSDLENPLNLSGRWSLYFYVPRGTAVVGLYGEQAGKILNADGNEVLMFDGQSPGFRSVDVADGQDGRIWKIDRAAGAVRLLTVPP